jgi:hypothetical protein
MGVLKKHQRSGDSRLVSPESKTLSNRQRNRLIDLLCLELLATEGAEWSYDIYHKLKAVLSPQFFITHRIASFELYPQLLDRRLDRLRKQAFIRRTTEPQKSKKGPPQKPWDITLFGLLHVLEFREELWTQIDEIAANHADKLPLIFKKDNWKHFVEKGGKERVKEAIKSFCETYIPHVYTSVGEPSKVDELLTADLTHHILWFHLSLITLPPLNKASRQIRQRIFEREMKKTLEWTKIWMDGGELEKFLANALCYDYQDTVGRLYGIKLVMEYMNSPICNDYVDKVTHLTGVRLILEYINNAENNSRV